MAAKKKAAKKSSAKRSVKKSAKRSVKKVAKRSSAKKKLKKSSRRSAKSSTRYSIPAVPVSGSSRSSISSISTTPRSVASSSRSSTASLNKSGGSSRAVVIAVVIGVIILAVAVISRNSSSESATVTPAPVESEGTTPTEQPSTKPTTPLAAHEAPVGIVSIYNEGGAMVNWKAPAASDGITGYNVELRDNGVGQWRLVATVPATEFKQQINKSDTTGWVQVKVSTVYSDGEIVAGVIHGLPGSWA